MLDKSIFIVYYKDTEEKEEKTNKFGWFTKGVSPVNMVDEPKSLMGHRMWQN